VRIGATNVLIFAATVAAADGLATVVVVVGTVVVAVVELVEPFDEPRPADCFHFRVFPAPMHTNVTDFTLRITPALEHLVPAMFGVAACVAEPTATRANRVAEARRHKRRLDRVFTPLLTVGGHRSDKEFAVT
jgi:hypothetical protein